MNIVISKMNPETGDSKIKAYFDLILDNVIVIKKCKLVDGAEGLFLSVPRNQDKNGSYQNLIFFMNLDVKVELEKKAIAKYAEIIATTPPTELTPVTPMSEVQIS